MSCPRWATEKAQRTDTLVQLTQLRICRGDSLMAEIFRYRGIKFIIYSDDHNPDHCHAKSADFEVKINISGDQPVLIDRATSDSKESKFQKTALKLAQLRFDELKTAMEVIKDARN
jgi:hypothetical protein